MNVGKLKIAELKKALKERGLPTTGNKSELAARLKEALSIEGSDTSLQDDDIEAKESELLGEEEDEEDVPEPAELDTKLLDTPSAAAVKPKKIVINREAAASAQQAATEAIAQQEAAARAEPPPAADAAPPPNKRIRLTSLTQMDRLEMRSQKNGAATTGAVDTIKVLTAEERKAARLAKFGTPTNAANTVPAVSAGGDAPPAAGKVGTDLELLKKRADRFGEVVSNKVKTLAEKERLQKRKERFGIVVPEEAKARRAARFSLDATKTTSVSSDPATEEKKKLRAARFGST